MSQIAQPLIISPQSPQPSQRHIRWISIIIGIIIVIVIALIIIIIISTLHSKQNKNNNKKQSKGKQGTGTKATCKRSKGLLSVPCKKLGLVKPSKAQLLASCEQRYGLIGKKPHKVKGLFDMSKAQERCGVSES